MTPLLHPHLVNGRFGDPVLYVDCLFERRAMLFDLGDLHALSPRRLLRVRDIFVSHTHIDHFIGFDQLLRLLVGRDRALRLFGPAGIIDRVEHRLGGYSWNLVDRYATDLVIAVTEVISADAGRRAVFRFRNRFRREQEQATTIDAGLLSEDRGFRVRCAVLDHRIPCLGFAIEERQHVNVWKNRLDDRGLPVGPWLREAKQAVLEGRPGDTPLRVRWRAAGIEKERTIRLDTLTGDVLRTVPGQKLGYVVDAAHTPANVARIVELVRGADILFIEAAFARADGTRAADRAHLTTEQAGQIAGLAGARRVEPMHFSPRYAGDGDRLAREVEEAFQASRGHLPAP